MSERYFMERGDVLMSVHLVLAAERERVPLPATPPLRRTVSSVAPKHRLAPSTPSQPPRTHPAALIDPDTGAPNLDALRRDIHLAGGRAALAKDRSVLVALKVRGLVEVRSAGGLDAANAVLRALIELVPFSLRGRDRVYRVAFDELAFLMTDTFEEGADVALERLAEESAQMLSARALPPVELVTHLLDTAMLAEAV